jgi:hypothetical protein
VVEVDAASPRSTLRSVAVPSEHGGWGLTAEPVLLGLLVAPSAAGALLGLASMVAFLARTPLRVVLVDRHRHRHLPRTRLARQVLAVEAAVLVALVAAAVRLADGSFWWPALVAAPLAVVALGFDARSRSRRLLPELAGTAAIAAAAPMIVLAVGEPASVAVAAWLIVAARDISSITHVVGQVARLHGRTTSPQRPLAADAAALLGAATAVAIEPSALAGAVAVGIAVVLQRPLAGRPVPAKTIGLRQTALGAAVTLAAAAGFHLA